MTSEQDSDVELSTTQVSALLGVPVNTLRSWRLRQVGPPSRRYIGLVRYRRSEVLAWRDGLEVRCSADDDAAADANDAA